MPHAMDEAGGKPFFAQGSVQVSRAQLEAFFASLG